MRNADFRMDYRFDDFGGGGGNFGYGAMDASTKQSFSSAETSKIINNLRQGLSKDQDFMKIEKSNPRMWKHKNRRGYSIMSSRIDNTQTLLFAATKELKKLDNDDYELEYSFDMNDQIS